MLRIQGKEEIESIETIFGNIREKMTKEHHPCHDDILHKILTNNDRLQEVLSKKKTTQTFLTLLHDSAALMAPTILGYDKELYDQLDVSEFLREPNKEPIPTLASFTLFFNNMSALVISSILKPMSIDGRTLILEYWINVAYLLLKNSAMADVNLMAAIVGAINEASISRLSSTFQGLSKTAKKQLKEMEALVSPLSSSKKLRQFMQDNPSAVPYLGIYISDFTSVREHQEEFIQKFGIKRLAQAHEMYLNIANNHAKCTKIEYKPKISRPTIDGIITLVPDDRAVNDSKSLLREPRNDKPAPSRILTSLKNGLYKPSSVDSKHQVSKSLHEPTPNEQFIILDNESIPFLPYLKAIGMTQIGLITDGVDKIPNNIKYTISRSNHKKDLTLRIDAAREYYQDKAHTFELYSLVTYGKVLNNQDKFSEESKRRIAAQLNAMQTSKKEFDAFFVKLIPILEKEYLAEKILGQRNSENVDKIKQNNTILLEDYALDLLKNSTHHPLHTKELIYESSLKVIAILYLLQTSPNILKNLNNIQLVKNYLRHLEGAHLVSFIKMLHTPDPIHENKMIIDVWSQPN